MAAADSIGRQPTSARASPPQGPLDAGGDDALLGPDRASERVTVYWIIFLLLLGGSLLLRNNPYASSSAAHTMMESIATLLAFIVGGLALVRYYSRKQATFLFIGTGFLGAALLDLNHALISSDWLILLRGDVDPEDWSWTAERVFLSLFLFFSLLAWRQEMKGGEKEPINEASVFVTALVLTLINLFFFEWVPLTSSRLPFEAIARPQEFLPALFFILAFFGFLRKGSWKRDSFDHWLLVSLLISGLAHAAFIAFSAERHDAMYDAAHLLKIASYLAILTGLLFNVYLTFTREGRVLDALTESNEALAREIDVRAKTERAVKESSARLQDFLDNANDLIQSVEPGGKVVYVNSSWKRVLGYTDEDLEKLNLFDIVHPGYRSTLESTFSNILRGSASRRFNVEYIAADGRTVILSGSAQPQLVKGTPVGTQAILRDVTEQRLAERQLAESRANLGALVENTGDAIWSVDRGHRLITFNSAFALATEANTGVEPDVGRLPEEIFTGDDITFYREMYTRTLQGERNVWLRTEEAEGQLRYFELYANPIQALEGVSGAVFFGKDVTPRVRAEEALRVAKEEAEAANKAKSDFLANMSHELRTPLNSVIGFTNILIKNKDGRLTEKDVGFLQRVLANGKHLLALINEVLDLAKVEAGRMELIIEEIDLAHLCVETVQQLEGQAKAKDGHVQLIAAVPERVRVVETDSAKLKQVIINLVGNALKFTQEGSVTVRLELASDGETPVGISVVDTGIGIPPDRLEAIFEAFQQAEAGTSRKYGGTGLGLALSRSICLLMGYDLIVESTLGEGSTFKIVMGERARRPEKEADEPDEPRQSREPAATASGAAGSTKQSLVSADDAVDQPQTDGQPLLPAVAPSSRQMREFEVLVVDDEKDSRVLMAHYLQEFGCRVITAADGESGIEAARSHRPDLITLDLMMPGMTGWEVLKRLKADPELRRIPVVVVSIVAGEGRGRLLGAVDLITKPFEREDLLRVLWRNLVRHRGGRVLVVDDEEGQRKLLAEFLGRVGLECVTAADGLEALEAVRTEAPDAVLLDLMMPTLDGIGFLEQLRADPHHTGLPVFVLTGKEVTRQEKKVLDELASAVILKQNAAEELEHLLGAIFTLKDTQGSTG